MIFADFDPEADIPDSDSDASGDDDVQEDKSASAREHYAPVAKSKLRKPKEIALGPQYSGSRVTRDAVEGNDDDEDDPFARGFEDEDSEDDGQDSEEGTRGIQGQRAITNRGSVNAIMKSNMPANLPNRTSR
jgi:protein AATF/BFR2